MTTKLTHWQVAGFGFTSLAGTLLHFVYEWANKSTAVAPFAATNESTWEHMKLLFFPLIIFALIEAAALKGRFRSFWSVKLAGTLLGLTLIPVLFYTYNGAFGRSPNPVNIAIFFIAAAGAFAFEARLFKATRDKEFFTLPSVICLTLIAAAFIIFTFKPPEIPLFQDPLSGLYGPQ